MTDIDKSISEAVDKFQVEIDRLTQERDVAERELLALRDELDNANKWRAVLGAQFSKEEREQFHDAVLGHSAEILKLTAELAALRAELAAALEERDAHHAAELNALERAEKAEAERDALRKLLKEARAHLKTGQWAVPTDITLMSRIDAALNKGGGDE